MYKRQQDSGATEHPYPRAKDPASRQILTISNVTTNTFDVQVLANTPSTNTTTHTFVRANKHGIRRAAIHTGGAYNHIFITSSNDSLTSYVGGGAARCVNEASAISTLMGIPINLFSTGVSNPNSYISGITRTLPKEWPFTGERAIIRDISITYDQNGSGDCATEASTISTLFGYLINVIDTAAKGNGNYFANQGIARLAPAQTNTLLAGGGLSLIHI